ncbi:MAG: hypothetical protein ACK4E3_01575 [Brevundimonas sp.]|uniref:hypothetical protein n=1 Tax=Brevundimonas sp. TaxID=1871086 RepID=UPI00391DD9AF
MGFIKSGSRHVMRTAALGAVAAAGLALTGCADLVTGGPLIRPGEPVGSIEIVNVSGRTLREVLISACNMSSYGLNRLPSGTVIPSGRSYRFTVSAGCWDIHADAGTGQSGRRRTQVLAGQNMRINITPPRN